MKEEAIFVGAVYFFKIRVEIAAVEITAQKLFPPLHIRKTASEVQK